MIEPVSGVRRIRDQQLVGPADPDEERQRQADQQDLQDRARRHRQSHQQPPGPRQASDEEPDTPAHIDLLA